MNAKHRNQSERSLFLNGGRLDVLLWGRQEAGRQFAEARQEGREKYMRLHPDPVPFCPCGCGVKEAICDAHIARVNAANEEIPF